MASKSERNRLESKYQEICKNLLDRDDAGQLDRPLAYWVLQKDRSLPLALIGKTLRELCEMKLAQLAATPSVGEVKLFRLVELLDRAANSRPQDTPAAPFTINDDPSQTGERADLYAADLSEALWAQWQQVVNDRNLGSETLGRLAPSLQSLPRGIWNTPLDAYSSLSLAQLRGLKTHGEKRVQAVTEIFGSLHALLAGTTCHPHLTFCVSPRFTVEIEKWAQAVTTGSSNYEAASVRRSFIEPLIFQVEVDLGPELAQLARSQLRLDGEGESVRQVARSMGLTRSRVYQLLGDIGAIMHVRWPAGREVIAALQESLHRRFGKSQDLELVDAVAALFFPTDNQSQTTKHMQRIHAD